MSFQVLSLIKCCSLVGEVFLEESGELELAVLDPSPLDEVQHVRTEEQHQGN